MISAGNKIYYVYEIQYAKEFNNIYSYKYINSILRPMDCTLFVIKGNGLNGGMSNARILLVCDEQFDGNLILMPTEDSRPHQINVPYKRIYGLYSNFYDKVTSLNICGTSIDLKDRSSLVFEEMKEAIRRFYTKGMHGFKTEKEEDYPF